MKNINLSVSTFPSSIELRTKSVLLMNNTVAIVVCYLGYAPLPGCLSVAIAAFFEPRGLRNA